MKDIQFISVLLLLLTSCSSNSIPEIEHRGFKVSATANGKVVEDLNQVLVHRVEISDAALNKIFGDSGEDPNFKKLFMLKKASAGAMAGLEVEERGIDKLGLEAKDTLLSIGSIKIENEEDFWHLKEAIQIDKSAELTIVRKGRANKILYYLNSIRSR